MLSLRMELQRPGALLQPRLENTFHTFPKRICGFYVHGRR